jgi:hypothetical protein
MKIRFKVRIQITVLIKINVFLTHTTLEVHALANFKALILDICVLIDELVPVI